MNQAITDLEEATILADDYYENTDVHHVVIAVGDGSLVVKKQQFWMTKCVLYSTATVVEES